MGCELLPLGIPLSACELHRVGVCARDSVNRGWGQRPTRTQIVLAAFPFKYFMKDRALNDGLLNLKLVGKV